MIIKGEKAGNTKEVTPQQCASESISMLKKLIMVDRGRKRLKVTWLTVSGLRVDVDPLGTSVSRSIGTHCGMEKDATASRISHTFSAASAASTASP